MSNEELTREQAIALGQSNFWKSMTHREVATFQLYQRLLCMPFGVFHEAVEKALGRPVFTHEFANPDALKSELMGYRPPPSIQEIIEMIPSDKRILISL